MFWIKSTTLFTYHHTFKIPFTYWEHSKVCSALVIILPINRGILWEKNIVRNIDMLWKWHFKKNLCLYSVYIEELPTYEWGILRFLCVNLKNWTFLRCGETIQNKYMVKVWSVRVLDFTFLWSCTRQNFLTNSTWAWNNMALARCSMLTMTWSWSFHDMFVAVVREETMVKLWSFMKLTGLYHGYHEDYNVVRTLIIRPTLTTSVPVSVHLTFSASNMLGKPIRNYLRDNFQNCIFSQKNEKKVTRSSNF